MSLRRCVHCHQVSNLHDGAMRRTLAAECAAPVGVDESVKLRENSDLKRIRSAGRALQANRKRGSIPASRLAELEQVLVEHFQVDALTPELVDEAAGTDVLEHNGDYVPHSRAVVLHHMETDGLSLLQFETRWRKHFIRTMKPKFLHKLWSVDHQAERLQVKAKENRIDLEQYKLATDLVPAINAEVVGVVVVRGTCSCCDEVDTIVNKLRDIAECRGGGKDRSVGSEPSCTTQ